MKKTLFALTSLYLLFTIHNSLVYADNAVLVKTIVGLDTIDIFGSAIASVDYNGDGKLDLVIGADPSRVVSPGHAYLYYGGAAFDSLYDGKYTGVFGRVGDYTGFGKAVSSAGDFNKDGYDDIVIGSPHYDLDGSSTGDDGRIYLYKGGPTPDTIPLWYLDTPYTYGAEFGYSVAGIGDLNKDGCGDIIAGAPIDIDPYQHDFTGAAYIFLGDSTNPDSGIDYELWGKRMSERFGYSVGSCDLNGDGWKDVLVGAQGIETIPADTTILGRVYVYLGGAVFDTTCDLYYQGRQKGAHFGRSISSGDFNNDGYEDIIVGEYGYNSNTGRAYIYLGGATPDTVPDLILNGEQAGCFGYQVCGAGDLNGDSIDDYIVSAPWHSTAIDSFAGRVYVYYGGTILDTLPDVVITGWQYKDRIGRTISALGDINNDGKREYAILKWIRLSSEFLKILVYQINVNGVEGNNEGLIMNKLSLFQNQPNPFKNRTTISYKLPKPVNANLSIYNITGQRVKTLVNGIKPAGEYNVFWDGRNDNGELSPNGVYFYTLKANNYLTTKKAILLK